MSNLGPPVDKIVLSIGGLNRLAALSGVLRQGQPDEGPLVIESGQMRTPVVILAPHLLNVDGALVADAEGHPLVQEGDRVKLTGGLAPVEDPRYPAFLAERVALVDP